MKYEKIPLCSEYLTKVKQLKLIELVVLGKDPYPMNPTGIPFMKSTWSEMNGNSSGFHILNSIFGGLPSSDKYESPKDYANYLLSIGIVFLNCSYHYLGGKLSKNKHKDFLDEAAIINSPILLKSNRVILCGKEVSSAMLCNSKKYNYIEMPHPSRFSRKSDPDNWDRFWACNQLRNIITKNN
jgi:uracil DNA glycosylase